MKKFLKDRGNIFSFAIGLIPSILLFIFPPTTTVPYSAFAVILLLLVVSIWLATKYYLDLKDNEIAPYIPIIECVQGLCICKANDFLSYKSIVTFYEKNGNCEQIIGYGCVETITIEKMAQITVKPTTDEIDNFISYINDHKNNIIVRPTLTLDTLKIISEMF